MTYRTRLSSKGQIVLPKPLRVARRWSPGTEFLLEEHGAGLLLKPGVSGSSDWASLIGAADYRGPRKSLKEMTEAINVEARKHR
ncbi:MAG TPA: AbrB/MazE/SpoVT family DNA-binding domain-containing protein [Candidatus Binataceae bacterium]|nr:AbrB/MazE/SpoVT family DNA-binding domain-containing protein [Candidatus Binataceae bacterium]